VTEWVLIVVGWIGRKCDGIQWWGLSNLILNARNRFCNFGIYCSFITRIFRKWSKNMSCICINVTLFFWCASANISWHDDDNKSRQCWLKLSINLIWTTRSTNYQKLLTSVRLHRSWRLVPVSFNCIFPKRQVDCALVHSCSKSCQFSCERFSICMWPVHHTFRPDIKDWHTC